MAKRVHTNIPPTMLMLDSRSETYARDNGSTVTFNIPQGMDSVTETQTALIQLVDFQASNSFYNITNLNNTLEVFVQLYDATGLALSKTSTSSVVTIPNGYYNAYDLVNTLNTALHAIKPTARPTGTSSTAGWYYNSFGIPAGMVVRMVSTQLRSIRILGKLHSNYQLYPYCQIQQHSLQPIPMLPLMLNSMQGFILVCF